MGKKPKPKPKPSPPIREQNWTGRTPPRIREAHEYAEQVFYAAALPDIEQEQDTGAE